MSLDTDVHSPRCGHHPHVTLDAPTVTDVPEPLAHLVLACPECFPELFEPDPVLADVLPSPREQLDGWIAKFDSMVTTNGTPGSSSDFARGLVHCLRQVRRGWDEDRCARHRLEETMEPYELEMRRVVVDVNLSGLLADEWSKIPRYDVGPKTITWSRTVAGEQGWLTVYPPDTGRHLHPDRDPNHFMVWAAWGRDHERATEVQGVSGTMVVEALVAAIDSVTP